MIEADFNAQEAGAVLADFRAAITMKIPLYMRDNHGTMPP